ncbi:MULTISPECIES: hypothetical protein [unclassified Aureispira]|uniref:hypothetical protein n=1 Tax=unclassified Aureispira TaxID=2649989 RepID=UPI0006981CB3|nr:MULTISPECIES: hypothetical protein [unclassified Aureispira]WMX15840.1 hypothetical protein QP953_05505 [Aureispira sp. CCB-E]
MKKIAILVFTFLALSFSSCDDGASSIITGQIIGKDVAACSCCGGYLILINNFTYRFFDADLPAGTTFLNNATFPITVELEFENQSNLCNNIDRISISRIVEK